MIHRPGPSTPLHGLTIGRGFQLRRAIRLGPFLISVPQLPILIKFIFGMSRKTMLAIGEPIASTFFTPPLPQPAEMSPPMILQAAGGPKLTGVFHSPREPEMAMTGNHLTFRRRVGPATSAFKSSVTTEVFAWDLPRSPLPRGFPLELLPSSRSLQPQSLPQARPFGETSLRWEQVHPP